MAAAELPSRSSMRSPPPRRSPPAAQSVLTTAALLKTITSFQTGIPEELWLFIRQRFPDQDSYRSDSTALSLALAEHGSLRLVQLAASVMWYDVYPDDSDPRQENWQLGRVDLGWLGTYAIQFNHPEIVQWILETGRSWFGAFETNLSSAIAYYQHGDTRILDLLAAHDMLGRRNGTLEHPREQRHSHIDSIPDMTLLRWLQEHVPEMDASWEWMNEAVRRGDLGMLCFMHKHRTWNWTSRAYEDAWANGHREVWWFLVENGPKTLPFSVMDAVIWTAGRRFLRRLRRAQIKVDPIFMDTAVRRGKSRLVGLLWDELGMSVPRHALVAAAADGHIGVFGCLQKREALHDPEALKAAVDTALSCGHLKLVKLIHSQVLGAFTKETMDHIAERGDLEMLKFLHEGWNEGCTVKAMNGAARHGHVEVVKFLHENRTEGCTADAMKWAAANGHLPVVEFLHLHRTEGCTTDAMDYAAEQNHLHVVQFLHENRTEGCTHQAIDCAGSVEVLQYLLENRSERPTVPAIRWVSSYALETHSVKAMKLLYRHYPDLFTEEVLVDVLTSGCFDLWKTLRSQLGCDDSNDGAKEAMKVATKSYRLHIIRFLLCDERRTDLVVPAFVDSSLRTWERESAMEWLMVLNQLAGNSIPIAEIIETVIIRNNWGVCEELEILISAVSKSAEDHRRNVAHALSVSRARNGYVTPAYLETMEYRGHGETRETKTKNPLTLESDLPSWVYHELYAPCSTLRGRSWQCPSYRIGQPTWIKSAIMHEDLTFVQRLHRLSKNEEYRDDPKFSFEGARLLAAYLGQLETLSWLIAEVPEEVPTDADLLDAALCGKKTAIIGPCTSCCQYCASPPVGWLQQRPCSCKQFHIYGHYRVFFSSGVCF